jgi:hypothetical protein
LKPIFIAPVEFKNSTSENQSPEVITVEKTVGVPDVSSKKGSGNSDALPNVAPGQHGRRFSISRIALLAAAVLVGSALISGITVHYVRSVNASKGKANRSSSLVVLPLEASVTGRVKVYFPSHKLTHVFSGMKPRM